MEMWGWIGLGVLLLAGLKVLPWLDDPEWKTDNMSDTPDTNPGGEQFDGTADDVVISDEVRKASQARIAAAQAKYGNATSPAP